MQHKAINKPDLRMHSVPGICILEAAIEDKFAVTQLLIYRNSVFGLAREAIGKFVVTRGG